MRPPKTKFCRICNKTVTPFPRKDKKGYRYPRQCSNCKNKPRNEQLWRENMSKARIGEKNPQYKPDGTKCFTNSTKNFRYIKIKINGSWKYEHRVIMEQIIGRSLFRYEIVHHKNGNTLDNNPDNLELIKSIGKHMSCHLTGKSLHEEHKRKIKENHWRKSSSSSL